VGLPDCITQGNAAAVRIGEWLGVSAASDAPEEVLTR
jgi:hypothetical protein